MSVECIFLEARDFDVAPGYFKKAILECEEEWSQHRKLYDTRGSIRGAVPPGFAYFAVGFGLQAGYAHHVEDEATWPKDFGRDVLEGLLEHEVRAAALDPTRAAPPRRVAVSAEARCRVAACCRRDLLPTRPAAYATCCPRGLLPTRPAAHATCESGGRRIRASHSTGGSARTLPR